jgi:hypothetical protein
VKARRIDVVVVAAFDRFSRSVRHLVETLELFRHLGVEFVSLREQIDTGSPLGQAVFTIIAAIAELGRSLIAERVRAGLRRARAEGKRLGRPPVAVDPCRLESAIRRNLPVREAARAPGLPIHIPPARTRAGGGPGRRVSGGFERAGHVHRILNPPEYPSGAAPAAKTRAFRRLARRSSGWCGCIQGTTHRGARLRNSRLGERALAARGGRSGAIRPPPAGPSQPRTPSVEVMARAI